MMGKRRGPRSGGGADWCCWCTKHPFLRLIHLLVVDLMPVTELVQGQLIPVIDLVQVQVAPIVAVEVYPRGKEKNVPLHQEDL